MNALTTADLDAIAAALAAAVDDLARLLDVDEADVAAAARARVDAVAPGLFAQMQRALRERYGTLDTPLTTELRAILADGVIGDVLLLAYRSAPQEEKAWADEWRSRFEGALNALAAGVDTLELDAADPARAATHSLDTSTRQFTADGLLRILT